MVRDHLDTLKLQNAGCRFPHYHARLTDDGTVEEILPVLTFDFSEWARTTL